MTEKIPPDPQDDAKKFPKGSWDKAYPDLGYEVIHNAGERDEWVEKPSQEEAAVAEETSTVDATVKETKENWSEMIGEIKDITGSASFDKREAWNVTLDPANFTAKVDAYQPQPKDDSEHVPTGGHATTLKDGQINNQMAEIVTPPEPTPDFVEQARKDEEDFQNGLRGAAYANGKGKRDAADAAEAARAEKLRDIHASAWTGRPDDEKTPLEKFQNGLTWMKDRSTWLGTKLKELGVGIKDNAVTTAKGLGKDATALGRAIVNPIESAKSIYRGSKSGVERVKDYSNYFKQRQEAGDSKLKILGEGFVQAIEGYNKLPMHRKLEVTAALIGSAALTGAVGLGGTAFVLTKAMFGQRILAATGFGITRSRDDLVAEQSNLVKYGYAGAAGLLYGGTTMIAGRYATEHLKNLIAGWLGHSSPEVINSPTVIKGTFGPAAVVDKAIPFNINQTFEQTAPPTYDTSFGVGPTHAPGALDAMAAAKAPVYFSDTGTGALPELHPDGVDHAVSAATPAPHVAIHAHVAHHFKHEGISLDERDHLETQALNTVEAANPGVAPSPELVTAEMNRLLAEHMKHAAHIEMLNTSRAGLGLHPLPKPELAPAVPAAPVETPVAPIEHVQASVEPTVDQSHFAPQSAPEVASAPTAPVEAPSAPVEVATPNAPIEHAVPTPDVSHSTSVEAPSHTLEAAQPGHVETAPVLEGHHLADGSIVDSKIVGDYVDGNGNKIVFGGTLADRIKAASEWVSKDHTAVVYFDSTKPKFFGLSSTPHLSKMTWEARDAQILDVNSAPTGPVLDASGLKVVDDTLDSTLKGVPLPTAEALVSRVSLQP